MRHSVPAIVVLSLIAGLTMAADTSNLQGRNFPFQLRDEGVSQGIILGLDCVGAGISCGRDGGVGYITVAGGGGGGGGGVTYDGGKIAAAYAADASIFAQKLLVDPTDCTAGQYATAIDQSGNLTCSTPSGSTPYDGGKVGQAYMADASITAQVAQNAYSADASYLAQQATVAQNAYAADASITSQTATALAANPTDCGGGQFANAIDSQGNLTCATPASSGDNFVEQSIVLSDGSGFFQAVVTGATWVTATSKIVCSAFGNTDAGLTPEAVSVGNLEVTASDRVVGTGFTINVFSPHGLDGTVQIHCTGA